MSDLDRAREPKPHDGCGYRTQSLDADVAFERGSFETWRASDAVGKARRIDSMARDAAELTRAGVRLRHPLAGEHELDLRTFALRLGREWLVRVYGWDPEVQGW